MFDVLCLDIAGNPWRWLYIERAAHYVASGKVAWELGEGAIVLRGGVNRHGRRSELIVHPVIALARSESMVRHLRETLALVMTTLCLHCVTRTFAPTAASLLPGKN